MLDKQGIKTSAELFFTDEQARDMLENPQIFMTPLSKMSDDLIDALRYAPDMSNSIFRADKNKEIIFISANDLSWQQTYEIDPDITPILDRIESQQLSNHIKWMRELT